MRRSIAATLGPPLLRAVLTAATALAAVPALAQPAQPARPGGAQPAAPQPEVAPGEPAPPPQPRPLEVRDPALAPVPPAKNTLQSWRDAVTLASTRSTELAVAVHEIARAEALASQAMGAVLFNVSARGSLGYSLTHVLGHSSTPTPGFDFRSDGLVGWSLGPGSSPTRSATSAEASITLAQPILAPRAWHAVGTARRAVEVAKLSTEDQRRVVLAVVADGVVNVVTAERVAEINRVGLRTSLELLELTRRRSELGTGTKLDVVRAEQDVSLARAQVVTGDESLRQTREALGLALGSSEAYGVNPGITLNEVESSMRSICTPGEADQRADVRAARAEIELAERDVTDAKLALAPYAEVSTSLGVRGGSEVTGAPLTWSIQGLITIPIWDGGRYPAIRAARAQVEQQKARAGATVRAAELEQTQAQRSVAVAEQSRVIAAQARDLAAETARLTRVAFQAGTSTSFELVQASQRLREAELQLALREFEVVKAKITALLATASCRY